MDFPCPKQGAGRPRAAPSPNGLFGLQSQAAEGLTVTDKNIMDFSRWRSSGGFDEPFQKLLDGIKRYYGAADGK